MEARGLRITRIRLEGIRSFADLELDLTDDAGRPSNITVVIGKNGTNKTTLLRAVALALSDNADATALLAQPVGNFRHPDVDEALIDVDLRARDRKITLRKAVRPSGSGEVVEWAGKLPLAKYDPFVCGYGAGRSRVGTDSKRAYRVFDGVLSLFNYETELIDPELTVRRLLDYVGTDRHEAVMRGLVRVLDLTEDDQIVLSRGGGLELTGPSVGKSIPLHAWADGYRLTLLWVLDVFARAMSADRIGPEGRIEGILLVDEIDQHLHPSLQAGMVRHLAELFPDMQMLLTTHSPLVALGADPSELVVLRRVGGHVEVQPSTPDYRGYSAEDMLADERLFDSDVHGPEATKMLKRYDELVELGPDLRSETDDVELRDLARRMSAQPLPPGVDESLAAAVKELRQELGGPEG